MSGKLCRLPRLGDYNEKITREEAMKDFYVEIAFIIILTNNFYVIDLFHIDIKNEGRRP